MAQGRRRFWSESEKRQIIAETRAPGVSVSAVARRHRMNANLLFTWLRDPRFAPTEDGPKLLPVDVAADGGVDDASPAAPPSSGRIEIELPNGVRLRCDAEALARVLDVIGLSA